MKTHAILIGAIFLSSCGAQMLSAPATAEAQQAQGSPASSCQPNETPLRITLKESFRYNPTLRDGTHRYLVIDGCRNDTRVRGTATTGVEDDTYYQNVDPVPHPEWVRTRPFTGDYQDQKNTAHGSWNEFKSDDGSLAASGNFYYNRDVTYQVDTANVPASIVGASSK